MYCSGAAPPTRPPRTAAGIWPIIMATDLWLPRPRSIVSRTGCLAPTRATCINQKRDNDDELTYRERGTALLDEFAHQARGVVSDARIGIDLIFVIFVVPKSGGV